MPIHRLRTFTGRPHRFAALVVVATVALTGAACDEALSRVTGPTPNLTVSFASIQRDIFAAPDSSGRPGCVSCHSDALARFNGGLSLQSNPYTSLVGAAAVFKRGATRVIPGDPNGSYLIQKLEGRGGIVGARMPFGGPYLTDGQISVIRRWIELGAQNN